jgi:hypothetical protein
MEAKLDQTTKQMERILDMLHKDTDTVPVDTDIPPINGPHLFESVLASATAESKQEAASARAVSDWIVSLNPDFEQYRQAFIRHTVTAAVLLSLDEKSLERELGVKSHMHRSTILKFRSRTNFSPTQTEVMLPRRGEADVKDEPLNVRVLANKQGLEDVEWNGKRVLIRVDYNVPIHDGKISDTSRIDATVPTLKFILAKHAELKAQGKQGIRSVAIICHLGRPPAGQVFTRDKYSLRPCVPVLAAHLGIPVQFLDDCVGERVEQAVLNVSLRMALCCCHEHAFELLDLYTCFVLG